MVPAGSCHPQTSPKTDITMHCLSLQPHTVRSCRAAWQTRISTWDTARQMTPAIPHLHHLESLNQDGTISQQLRSSSATSYRAGGEICGVGDAGGWSLLALEFLTGAVTDPTHLTSTSPPTCMMKEPSGCFSEYRYSKSFSLKSSKGIVRGSRHPTQELARPGAH